MKEDKDIKLIFRYVKAELRSVRKAVETYNETNNEWKGDGYFCYLAYCIGGSINLYIQEVIYAHWI